jgi:hypothetical protein
MSRDDWFRHEDWSPQIEMDFDAQLKRARDKVQPLKIQAGILAERRPDVALRLLDRYFESGDTLFIAQAYATVADARLALGDFAAAADALEAALRRESEFPNLKTNSFVQYPLLVAEHRLVERYGVALRVLESRKTDLLFPIQQFKWHAAYAVIAFEQGDMTTAGAHAGLALAAAGETSSGFARHKSLGLVGDSFSDLRARLRLIAI